MLPIPRALFDQDHAAFRDTVRRFMEQEVLSLIHISEPTRPY